MSDKRYTPQEVFDRARAVSCRDVAELCGAVLRGGGSRGWARARVCPLCAGKEDFSVCATGFRCHKCGEHGDGIALRAKFAGCSLLHAAADLAGVWPEEILTREHRETRADAEARRAAAAERAQQRRVRTLKEPDAYETAQVARAQSLWLRARPANGTIGERYLVCRGVPRWLAHLAARNLRFLEDAPYWDRWEDDVDARLAHKPRCVTPALLAQVQTQDGPTGGVHVTHLAEDGRGKAFERGAKKMHGPQLGYGTDGEGRPGGVLLVKPEAPNATLVVAEGIESALCAAALVRQRTTTPLGVFATLSLDRLQGGLGRGAWGGVDWRRPFPDPELPAATLAHAGPVVVAVDHDMAPLVVDKGGRWERTISPTRRAQVAGVLAAHWWKEAGASEVRILTPRAGCDPADELNARVREAAEKAA